VSAPALAQKTPVGPVDPADPVAPADPADRAHEAREIEFFADYYGKEQYNPHGWTLRLEREARSLLREAHGPLGRVMSIGCGDGEFEILLASRAEHVTGIDISPEAIELARRKASRAGVANVTFECVSMSDLKLDRTWDTVVCLAFLHHVPEAELPGFLATVARHLRPGGLFYSQDPNVHGVLRKVGRLVMGRGYDSYHSSDERELDPAAIRLALDAAGFERTRVGFIDLTLIPVTYVLRQAPAWVFRVLALVDRLWCLSPLARWASGFTATGRRRA
jgi:SAM-dependent methyltransferase